MKNLIVLMLVFASMASVLNARPHRVNQIPNGAKFQCANCHVNPAGGGTRTAFGMEIEANYLDASGNVMWGPALAVIDSDVDTKTNGEELQDPTGEWAIGQANPGDVNLVSNPGNPGSTTGVRFAAYALPKDFALQQNYPNPFNPSTTITFTAPKSAHVTLRIYNALGQPVRELQNAPVSPGGHSITWDGRDESGELMVSGLYLAQLESEGVSRVVRMLMMK